RCARPSSALRAPSPASGRRVEAVPDAQAGCAFFAPGFLAQAKKGGSRRHGAKALELAVAVAIAKQRRTKDSSLRSPRIRPPGTCPRQREKGGSCTGRAGGGVLSLRQVSLHKQRKVARAVTARKPLILMSAEERRVKTRPTGLRGDSRRGKT